MENGEKDFRNELLEYLNEFLTEERKQKFRKIIAERTRYITVVLEDIYQSQNASAVLRTCDCLGIQDVHIIEDRNEYEVNPKVVQGASKWIDMYKYNGQEQNTRICYDHLRSLGYRIYATTPHTNSVELPDVDIEQGKIAVVFGNEETGLTEQAISMADASLKIPMYGFTESFNISVSAALVLYHLIEKLRKSELVWRLSPDEQKDILIDWARNTIKRSETFEKDFYNRMGISFDSA